MFVTPSVMTPRPRDLVIFALTTMTMTELITLPLAQTHGVKIYSTKYFCNTKIAGLGKILVQRKFSALQYYNLEVLMTLGLA